MSYETTIAQRDQLNRLLCKMADAQSSRECTFQLLEWTFELFWATQLEKLLPDFTKAAAWLFEHHRTRDASISYGDADYSVWSESQSPSVVISECHCAARDDNITVFIDADPTTVRRFHARTCGPKLVRAIRGGKGWDYVDQAPLALYRSQKWEPRYGDFRDVGYLLSYESWDGLLSKLKARLHPIRSKIDGGFSHASEIDHALREMAMVIRIANEAAQKEASK